MASMNTLWLIVGCGVLAIVYGIWATQSVLSADAGSKKMQEISEAVREGAQAYLKRQYTTIAIVGVVIFFIIGYSLGWLVAIGFAIGAILSGATGFIGMNVSVRANVRVAQAATKSLAGGLELAFKAGAITGMLVAGLALLGVTIYFGFLTGTLHKAANDRTVIDAMVALIVKAAPDAIIAGPNIYVFIANPKRSLAVKNKQ
jgi:K(+)-stimulated pyrophosphate-energized sodium pump